MRSTVRLLGALLLAASLAALLGAQETSRQWTVYEPGLTTCADWARQRKAGSDATLRAWVAGFLSAAHFYQALFPDTFASLAVLGAEEQAKWLDSYCAGRPTDVLMIATRALLNDLAGRARR